MGFKVLMIGPGSGVVGGITTLTHTLIPVLEEQVELQYFVTVQQRPLKESGIISFKNIISAFSQYIRFWFAIHRFKPHIVHLHTSMHIGWLKDTYYVLMTKVYGRRIIVHIHASNYDRLYGENPSWMQSYTRKIFGLVDAVIAVSEEWRQQLAQIIPIDKITAFRNCIAVNTINPDYSQRNNGRGQALFLGAIGQRKGVFDLLDAMESLNSNDSPLSLWIAGGGERKGDLARIKTSLMELQLEDCCQLLGTVRGKEKDRLLSEANIFILPSYNEGLPMAILEAMAAGLAIISTPVGGIPEVVKDGYNGFLVSPGDVQALANRLAILANNRHLRETMGSRSRMLALEELDVKPYVVDLINLYESIIAAED